jgi:hypothetical protein
MQSGYENGRKMGGGLGILVHQRVSGGPAPERGSHLSLYSEVTSLKY